jgi:hypothetical protein
VLEKGETMMRGKELTLSILVLLGGAGAGGAQEAFPRKVYTNRTKFKLPIQVDDRERSRLQNIQLFVRENPTGPWKLRDSIYPSQREFIYQTAQDGEFWFTLQTVDKTGRASPADVSAEPPGLVVVVDRQPPEIQVTPVALGAGNSCLQCEVRDANPDGARTKLEYQSSDRSWLPLEPVTEQPNCFRVPDPSVLRGSVRATAADLAGNVVVREISLQPTSPGRPADTAVQPVVLEAAPDVIDIRATAAGPEMKPLVAEPRALPTPTDTRALPVPEVRAEKVAPTPPPTTGAGRQFINTNQATLRYQIDKLGPSGVGKIEVWVTRDEGQTWQRVCEDSGRQSAVTVNLPGEGSYGISLVVINGNGQGGEPPARGDVPDWKLEVDTTKPIVQNLTARPGTGSDAGAIAIAWSASDKNLRPEPIDLSYASHIDGPWMPIAKGLKNDGSYRWVMPKDIAQDVYVRIEVTDQSGNTTAVQTHKPVGVDRTRLKAQVISVVPGAVER